MTVSMKRTAASFLMASALLSGGAAAETVWDMPSIYPAGSFHVRNMETFAEEVAKATDGRVTIRVQPGGALGIAGTDMLAAIRDGIVPIADLSLNLSSGVEPLLNTEGQPFLIRSYDELKTFQQVFVPKAQEVMKKHNQQILTITPWPAQYVHLKAELPPQGPASAIPIRTGQRGETEVFGRVGFNAIQMPWGEVVPGLAAGTIEGVTTSASSGVDGKFWEFLTIMYPTNHVWNSQTISVNLDALNALDPADRQAILDVAATLQPVFLERSQQEDTTKRTELESHGYKVGEVSDEFRAKLEAAGAETVAAFLAATPEAEPIIAEFREKVGR
jgi:TRAP-type C4-dicarboxylate transport system substrate-binding protein